VLAKKNSWKLPEDKSGPGWIGYSQHAYECLPLRTEKLKATQVLDFRDKAFLTYFNSNDYLSMTKSKFGEDTVSHIKKMTSHKLNRKHHKETVDY
jgi:hypothetical protein